MRKITFLVGFLSLLLAHSKAQNNTSQNSVTIASPTAASLGKYADFPVSYHTGTPEINIPIYNVTAGTLSLPISLSYHASGIRAMESASWVGAGWALNAGGVITRSVVGAPDDRGLSAALTKYGHFHDYGYNSYLFTTGGGTCGSCPVGASHPANDQQVASGIIDGEPDLYSFNFGNYTGKFYFRDDRTPILIPEQDLKIQPFLADESGGIATIFMTGFKVTTPDGTQYYFGKNQTADGNPDAIEITTSASIHAPYNGQGSVSAWYLNKIVSADNQFSIVLAYKKEQYSDYTWSMFPIFNINNPNSFLNSFGNYEYDLVKNFIDGVRLSSISFPNGAVTFSAGVVRQDVGDFASKSIAETANTQATSLGGISIAGSDGFCKKYNFSYSYFYDGTNAIKGFIPVSYPQYSSISDDKYRLRLDKIQESPCDGTLTNAPYQFDYYTNLTGTYSQTGTNSFIPRRLTFGQDHWGFINNQNNNGLIPSFVLNKGFIDGANRDSQFPEMEWGTLHQITYPTGGTTTFDFEVNQVYGTQTTYSKQAKSDRMLTAGFTSSTQTATISNLTFTNDAYQIIMSNTNTYYTGRIQILKPDGVTVATQPNGQICQWDVPAQSSGVPGSLTTEWFSVTPGTYVMKLYNQYGTSGTGVTAYTYESVPATSTGDIPVGGLRIKTITTKDGVTANDMVTSFNYNLGQASHSTGVLYSRPIYVSILRNEVERHVGDYTALSCSTNGCINCDGTTNYTYFKSGGSVIPMQTVQGNHIGYGEVRVSQTNNGFSVYRYYQSVNYGDINSDVVTRTFDNTSCSAAIPSFPYPPVPFEYKRGDIQYEGHFNQTGQELSSTYYYPVYTADPMPTPAYTVFDGGPVTGGYVRWGTEYSLQSYYLSQMQKVSYITDPTTLLSVSTTTTDYYSSAFHREAVKHEFTNTTGELFTTNSKYVFDFRVPACDNLSNGAQMFFSDSATAWSTYNNKWNTCTDQGNVNCKWVAYQQYRFDKATARTKYINTNRTNFTDANNLFTANHDYTKYHNADGELKPLLELQDEYKNPVIETSDYKSGNLTSASFTRFDYMAGDTVHPYPNKLQTLFPTSLASTFSNAAVNANTTTVTKDSRYTDETFLKFNNGNPAEITSKDGVTQAYIWDYQNTEPVAKAINAQAADIAYTSFETAATGNWTLTGGSANTSYAITGNRGYMVGSTISKGGLNTTKSYIVSYWSRGYPLTVNSTAAVTGLVKNGWTYYQHTVPAGMSTITLTGSGTVIDELRLYPADAQMTTYTYLPLVGMTSACAANNLLSYYEYDALGRLARIRDMDKNILKQYSYKYQGQAGSADVPLCASVSASYSNGKTSGYAVSMTNTANGNMVSFSIAAAPTTHSPISGSQSNIPPGVYNVSITRTSGTATSTNFQVGNVYQTGTNFGANNIQISCPGTLTISIQ